MEEKRALFASASPNLRGNVDKWEKKIHRFEETFADGQDDSRGAFLLSFPSLAPLLMKGEGAGVRFLNEGCRQVKDQRGAIVRFIDTLLCVREAVSVSEGPRSAPAAGALLFLI